MEKMIKLLTSLLLLTGITLSNAQEETKPSTALNIGSINITVSEKKESIQESIQKEDVDDDTGVHFALVKNKPVYPGCEIHTDNTSKKGCFEQSVRDFVSNNFNTSLGNTLDIPSGKVSIYTTFTIDKNGVIKNVKAMTRSNPLLKEEAIRVVNLLPVFTPGQDLYGQPVSVIYSLPIAFMVD